MKEVFQEYGGVIVTVIAIMALITIVSTLVGGGEDGVIGSALSELIKNFLKEANGSFGVE